MSEGVGGRRAGGLEALVEKLVARVEALHADVAKLKANRSASTTAATQVPATMRIHPSKGEPVDLNVLAEWVEALAVRYATTSDWLRPCWWRHGLVVEELAALRTAWLAVYDASESVDPTAGVRWHEEAERCRERIRRAIASGPGCTAVSHKADEVLTDDTRWKEERADLRSASAPELETAPAAPPR